MIDIKSLQQRMALFLLLPVGILLLGMGFAGFVYTRDSLLAQWREATILKLQRAAHHVDMRLKTPKEWIQIYNQTARQPENAVIQAAVIRHLKTLSGVEDVRITSWRELSETGGDARNTVDCLIRFHQGCITGIRPPQQRKPAARETVTMISELNDKAGNPVARLEVALRFDYLMDAVMASGWWQTYKAFLVTQDGRILTGSGNDRPGRTQMGDGGNALEVATLQALMKDQESGTVMGDGRPPDEISGFYRLHEAPWYLVIIAPGHEIMEPLIRFRTCYLMVGSGFVFIILMLIRRVTGRTVSVIREVSGAARRIADGDFGEPLPVRTSDEVGELVRSFNIMTAQLEERIRLKNSLTLAMEVQQNLLPDTNMKCIHFDIAGRSIYCDETGGDYYDFFRFPDPGDRRIGIAVGDVAGHGISSALLMTTVRALLRSRIAQPGTLADIMTHVNRLLCADTEKSGSFMTLFLMTLDPEIREIRWVRAGHDPAFVCDPETGDLEMLGGKGMALGVDASFVYQEYRFSQWRDGQVILAGTDGIWETENPDGEPFGKERLKQIVRKNVRNSSGEILESVISATADFRGKRKQEDDITLVVIKTDSAKGGA